MSEQEVRELFKEMLEPYEEKIEELERKLELQANEIKILREGGNL